MNFYNRPFFEAPFGGNPLEFGDEIWRQKTRVLGLPDGEEIIPLAFFDLTQFDTIPARGGQTDRRTRCDRYYPR